MYPIPAPYYPGYNNPNYYNPPHHTYGGVHTGPMSRGEMVAAVVLSVLLVLLILL